MLASSKASKKFREKRQSERFILDLYLDDEIEKKVYEIFNAQRANKNLKKYLIEIVKKHEKLE